MRAFLLCFLLLLCNKTAIGCIEPTSGLTSKRFSVTIWSNISDGLVFSSNNLNISVSAGNRISANTPETLIEFPVFTTTVFPGAIVVSFFRFSWSVYALHQSCNGFSESQAAVTITPFLFEYEDALVTIPSKIPVLSDFDGCEEFTLYSLSGEFQTNPDYFPINPPYISQWISPGLLVLSKSTRTQSMCRYPRVYFNFVVAVNITDPVHVGEHRTLPYESETIVNATTYGWSYPIDDNNINYTTHEDVDPYTNGTDYLYLAKALLVIRVIPTIQAISHRIVSNEPNITILMDAITYVHTFGHYFRDPDGNLVLPGESITLSPGQTNREYTITLLACDFVQEATITIIRPTPITLEAIGWIPDSTSFKLGDQLVITGEPGIQLELNVIVSKGQLSNSICPWCTSFSFVASSVDELRQILDETQIFVSNATALIGDSDGVRIQVNDEYVYVRYLKNAMSTGPPTRSVVDELNASIAWIITYAWVIFGISMSTLVCYMLDKARKRYLKRKERLRDKNV